jgi:hypothetical protein
MAEAVIIDLNPDSFRPILPPADVRKLITADAWMLAQVEVWARSQRQTAEHRQTPLKPEARAKAMRVLAIVLDQPVI